MSKPATVLVSSPPVTPTLPIMKLTSAEIKERRDKGLCFNCDEKYKAGHKCKPEFLLLQVDDEEELEENNQAELEVLQGEDSVIEELSHEISLLAMAGKYSPRSMQIIGVYLRINCMC
ncbi:hypothetical protein CFOL_v3_25224 [Cephalotus follicularis]|uniref:Uncharacterized protein n=1 Tax=Cephalotus follicularis TaxID=3775 RepID=A0A1Q3CNT8_CEPFO|nr:hypothetical protein CFOL_v3_25224 [Cephalotus follicularis]